MVDPAGSGPIVGALNWLQGTLLGTVATTVAVIAVAAVGFMMLTGRLPIRRGLLTSLGAFILLAAPVVASGFAQVWQGQNAVNYAPVAAPDENLRPREDLGPSDYDPYAGASLGSD